MTACSYSLPIPVLKALRELRIALDMATDPVWAGTEYDISFEDLSVLGTVQKSETTPVPVLREVAAPASTVMPYRAPPKIVSYSIESDC
jgi:hypothetical protein